MLVLAWDPIMLVIIISISISIPHYTSCQDGIKDRKSKDLVCSSRGKELIDLCIAGNAYIKW